MSKFIISGFADEIAPDLYTQLEVLNQLGIKYFEIRGVNGKGINHHKLAAVKEMKKQIDAAGIKVSSLGSGTGKYPIEQPLQPHLDEFKKYLDMADILETDKMRMFSFFIPEGKNPADYRSKVMDYMSILIDTAKGRGITLCHENEREIYGDTAERCLDLMETLSGCGYFKFIFDPANFVLAGETCYPKAYNMLKDYIIYMHIKDAILSENRVVPSGEGEGGLPEILTDLHKNNFEGFVSLEPHLGKFAGLEQLEKSDIASKLPEGGAQTFGIAFEALNKILDTLK